MKVTKFKNGNFNVKADEENRELLEDLLNSIELDFTPSGDSGCASNYEMYHPLFNSNTLCEYLILDSDISHYKEGKTVKLIAQPLTDEEIKEIHEGY